MPSQVHRQGDRLRIGPDQVCFVEDKIVIYASRPMLDWDAREFSRIAIFFQERKYYLRTQADAEKPYCARYELWPWPAERFDPPAKLIIYDEAYVKERERDARAELRLQGLQYLLYPLFPILGLLWSKTKDRLCSHVGLTARSLTVASLILEAGVGVLWALIWSWSGELGMVIFGLANRQLVNAWTFIQALLGGALILLVGIDCLIRFDQVLREIECPAGFLEWLIGPLALFFRGKR